MRPATRRDVLGWMAAIGALPILGEAVVQDASGVEEFSELSSLMGYPLSSARAIGSAYLEIAPAEASSATLQGLIKMAIDSVAVVDQSSASVPVDRALRDRIRLDFAEGDVVEVRGWVLSRTEVRLCAWMTLAA